MTITAEDKRILDERFEANYRPDTGAEPELTSIERKQAEAAERHVESATDARDDARDLGIHIAAYGADRNADLISDLRKDGGEIEHNGATYSLEGNKLVQAKDGQTTKHDASDVQDGIEHRRSNPQTDHGQHMQELAAEAYHNACGSLSQWDGKDHVELYSLSDAIENAGKDMGYSADRIKDDVNKAVNDMPMNIRVIADTALTNPAARKAVEDRQISEMKSKVTPEMSTTQARRHNTAISSLQARAEQREARSASVAATAASQTAEDAHRVRAS